MKKLGFPRNFVSNTQGGMMILFAACLSLLMILIAGAIDYMMLSYYKDKLQNSVDAAAIAAAREFKLSNIYNASPAQIEKQLTEVAKVVLEANIKKTGTISNITVQPDIDKRKVTVNAELGDLYSPFGNFLQTVNSVHGKATAQSMGSTPLCALAMGSDAHGTIALNSGAKLTALKCAVYSNSERQNSITALDNTLVTAEQICSAGGVSGGKIHFEPDPVTDCPKLDDPLEGRPEPEVSSCDFFDMKLGTPVKKSQEKVKGSIKSGKEAITDSRSLDRSSNKNIVLDPGVYCGGLSIGSDVNIWLNPGVYIMKDGPLEVKGNASLAGENVGFYFKGNKSVFFFGQSTSVSLTAPRDGVLASILFFEARGERDKRLFTIFSDDARVLLGTIYLPHGDLYIDGYKPIADKSAYTVIISHRISMFSGPHLILNTDYSATDIPVPKGVLDAGNHVRLTQ